MHESRGAGPVRKRSGWTRRMRLGALVAAGALGLGFVALPSADAQIDWALRDTDIQLHRGPYNAVINCNIGGNQIDLAAWSCWAENSHFSGWWLVPNYLKPTNTVQHPEQIIKIGEDGSFNSGDLDATLAAMLAVASRGQAANIPQAQWSQSSAARHVGDAANPTSGKTAIDFVKQSLSGGCPASLELTARAGYYLFLMGESASQGSCNVFDTLRSSYNGSGQFGSGLRDTIWAWYAIASFASQDPTASAFRDEVAGPVADFIKGQQKGDGSFGDAPVIDFRTTAEAVMALLSNGVTTKDAPIVNALNVLAAHQNNDGGFGYMDQGAESEAEEPVAEEPVALTQTMLTAPVMAMGNAVLKGAQDPAAMAVFTQGPPWVNSQTVHHSGYQAIYEILGDYLLRQPGCSPEDKTVCVGPGLRYNPENQDGEGRFRHSVGDIDDDPITPPDTDEQIKDTRPTSDAMFGLIFYHPIVGVVKGDGGNVNPSDIGGETGVSPVTAQPNVTG